jgi:hypothetical protein
MFMYLVDVPTQMIEQFNSASESKFMKVVIAEHSVLFPRVGVCSASAEFQKWSFSIKNTFNLEVGTFANEAATVEISHDLTTWATIFTGFVSDEGIKRSIGYVTDDHVTLEFVDPTRRKGTKRKPPKALLTGFTICDPATPGSSILHYLANTLGVPLEVDTGLLDYTKEVVSIGDRSVWEELQDLSKAYHADMYFSAGGSLRFKSPLENNWTYPTPEWVFSGDPNSPPPANGSWIRGKVEQGYTPVRCNKAKATFADYQQLNERVIYENTENYNDQIKQCSIEIPPGAYWPGPNPSDKAQLKYKDPDTGEQFPFAKDIQTPTIGVLGTEDIQYSGGQLELLSFNGIAGSSPESTTKNPDSSEIILHNTGGTTCTIKVFKVRGIPFRQLSENTVEYIDPQITDPVDYVEQDYSSKWYADPTQANLNLQLKVESGKSRYRRLGFSTNWLPWLQRGAPVEVRLPGGITVTGKIISYEHKPKGKNLVSMYTTLIVEETEAWSPGGGTPVIVQDRTPLTSGRRGLAGEDGEDAITLVVVSTNGNIFRPELTDTILEARVYQAGEEITDQYDASRFRWTRKSDDSAADDVWNSAHYSTGGKSIQITDEDVEKRATFFCELI